MGGELPRSEDMRKITEEKRSDLQGEVVRTQVFRVWGLCVPGSGCTFG